MHDVAPEVATEPPGHCVQARKRPAAPLLLKPSRHAHVAAAATVLVEPCGHAWHIAAPVMSLNSPGKQAVHCEPSSVALT